MEREHERDEFQQEIRRLEAKLKHTASVDNKGHRVRPIRYQVCMYIKTLKQNISQQDNIMQNNLK